MYAYCIAAPPHSSLTVHQYPAPWVPHNSHAHHVTLIFVENASQVYILILLPSLHSAPRCTFCSPEL